MELCASFIKGPYPYWLAVVPDSPLYDILALFRYFGNSSFFSDTIFSYYLLHHLLTFLFFLSLSLLLSFAAAALTSSAVSFCTRLSFVTTTCGFLSLSTSSERKRCNTTRGSSVKTVLQYVCIVFARYNFL